MNDPPDDRPPMALAAEWTTRITTICLGMVLPGIAGLWIDRQLGTLMVFLVLGVILGATGGVIQIVRLAATVSAPGKSSPKSAQDRRKSSEPQSKP